jgi:hypothetical protein
MKLVTALSTAAFILAPAVCLAKDPTNEGVNANIGGDKCYPDSASVAKTAGSTSQNCPSSDANAAGTAKEGVSQLSAQPNNPSASTNDGGTSGGQQSAAKSAGSEMQNSSEGAKNQPGLVERAERVLEKITGRSATNEGASQEGVSQENAPQVANTSGDKFYPDWASVAKTEPASNNK